jgi:hypothetical protein
MAVVVLVAQILSMQVLMAVMEVAHLTMDHPVAAAVVVLLQF